MTRMQVIRIGTRGSELALWQANHVAGLLNECHPDVRTEIVPIKTEADRRLDVSLSEVGGKGLFIKELEHSLLENHIDIAVHSMKDVTVNLPPEFRIDVILDRGNPYDALVSNRYVSIDELPADSVIGTCSLRRKTQLQNVRPDLRFEILRGNVTTRLARLDNDEFDAIVLAVSGLMRLGRENRITQELAGINHIPSPGQGALGIECRSDDFRVQELIAPLNHEPSRIAVHAERLANRELGGSCVAPVGIHALISNEQMKISGSIGSLNGSGTLRSSTEGTTAESVRIAQVLADNLNKQGAQEILNAWESE